MQGTIFLSAGVPDPKRGPQFATTADAVAIAAAVSALLYVVLGRRPLVWGGQPAITPMVWAVAEGMGVDYGRWVTLYQSRFFEDEFPQDNQRFRNVVYTEAVGGDREGSLEIMRRQMFTENAFSAAVFIGGMGGVIDEYRLFRESAPNARVLPVVSTGGASLELANLVAELPSDLFEDLDYVELFHRYLEIDMHERRYATPELQPAEAVERRWRRDDPSL